MSYTRDIVPYRRVSTKRQGESGLGLEAQENAIEAYRAANGHKIIGGYTEVETGKKHNLDNRPELLKAIGHAKRSNAILVIAKLDRLTRSVAVTSALMESGVEFVACDIPFANKLTIYILAAMAEWEAEQISARTKASLGAYKAGKRVSKCIREMYPDGVPQEVKEARGGKLGAQLPECKDNLTAAGQRKGIKNAAIANKAKAVEAYTDLVPIMRQWRDEGKTLQAIADELTAMGHTTRRQKPWNKIQVSRVLERVAGVQ